MRIWNQREMWRERKTHYRPETIAGTAFEAFDPATGTHEQAEATGNLFCAVELSCHQCKQKVYLAIEVGQDGGWEECATLCRECLDAASKLLAEAEALRT